MPQQTLLNIKPDAVKRNLIGEIIKRIEDRGFRIAAIRKVQLTSKDAKAFYAIHKEKFFFDDLVAFMTSGPCVPIVVEGESVIEGIRELIGATDPAKAAEGTIRRDFAESVTRNSVHASDSLENAAQEIDFFFARQELT